MASTIRHGLLPAVLVAVLVAGAAAGRWSAHPPGEPELPTPLPVVAADATALTEQALRLYAAGHFASACARFAEAAEEAAMSVYFQAARPAPVATTVVRSAADAIQPREFRNARLMMCGSLGSDVGPAVCRPGRYSASVFPCGDLRGNRPESVTTASR